MTRGAGNGSGVEIAVGVIQDDRTILIEVATVSARYSGLITDSREEIAGTWMQGGEKLPLTFRRARH